MNVSLGWNRERKFVFKTTILTEFSHKTRSGDLPVYLFLNCLLNGIGSCSWCYFVHIQPISQIFNLCVTDRRTNGRTNWWTHPLIEMRERIYSWLPFQQNWRDGHFIRWNGSSFYRSLPRLVCSMLDFLSAGQLLSMNIRTIVVVDIVVFVVVAVVDVVIFVVVIARF